MVLYRVIWDDGAQGLPHTWRDTLRLIRRARPHRPYQVAAVASVQMRRTPDGPWITAHGLHAMRSEAPRP